MVDTPWGGFTPAAAVQAADQFLAVRGAGGVNFNAAALADFIGKNAADGTVGAPGLSFASDPDTGLYRPGANLLGLVTNGVERARVENYSALRILSPTNATEAILSLDCANTGFGVRDSQIRGGNNGSNQTYLDFYTSNATAPARAMRIDSSANVGIGTVAPTAKCHVKGFARVEGGVSDTYQGLTLRNVAGSGSVQAVSFLEVRNENDYADGHIFFQHETNGSVTFVVGLAPSGIRTADRRVPKFIVDAAGIYSGSDNTQGLGWGGNRFKDVFAVNGVINTSDEETKQDITSIPDEWLDAWGSVQWVRYKFKDAVEAKGDDARWHVGLVAQRVRDAFDAAGLDALAIGLLCYDEWEEQREPIIEEQVIDKRVVVIGQEGTGVLGPDGAEILRDVTSEEPVMGPVQVGERVTLEAGDRWGLRYDECQAMEAAWQRRELARNSAISEERIAGLEAMNKLLSDRLAALEAAA